MNEKTPARRTMPLAMRIALCAGLGTALTVSNGAAVGLAVAAGLFLALTLGSRP